MKTKLILLAIIPMFFVHIAKGQGYLPLVDTNKKWSTMIEMIDFYHTYWTKFTDDTIISGKIYKKAIISDPIFEPVGKLVGYIREDSLKKIYFMNTSFEEGLIYDFGANIGDTIIIHNKIESFWYAATYEEVTIIVDTVYYTQIIPVLFDFPTYYVQLIDGIERKVVIVKNIDEYEENKDVWIEGIGSIAGVLGSSSLLDSFWHMAMNRLLCYFEDSIKLYYYPMYGSCFYTQVNINEYEKNTVTIFPNPIHDNEILTITVNEETISLHIFDCKGILVDYNIKDKMFSKNESVFKVSISKKPQGLYMIKGHTKNNIYYGKILKID